MIFNAYAATLLRGLAPVIDADRSNRDGPDGVRLLARENEIVASSGSDQLTVERSLSDISLGDLGYECREPGEVVVDGGQLAQCLKALPKSSVITVQLADGPQGSQLEIRNMGDSDEVLRVRCVRPRDRSIVDEQRILMRRDVLLHGLERMIVNACGMSSDLRLVAGPGGSQVKFIVGKGDQIVILDIKGRGTVKRSTGNGHCIIPKDKIALLRNTLLGCSDHYVSLTTTTPQMRVESSSDAVELREGNKWFQAINESILNGPTYWTLTTKGQDWVYPIKAMKAALGPACRTDWPMRLDVDFGERSLWLEAKGQHGGCRRKIEILDAELGHDSASMTVASAFLASIARMSENYARGEHSYIQLQCINTGLPQQSALLAWFNDSKVTSKRYWSPVKGTKFSEMLVSAFLCWPPRPPAGPAYSVIVPDNSVPAALQGTQDTADSSTIEVVTTCDPQSLDALVQQSESLSIFDALRSPVDCQDVPYPVKPMLKWYGGKFHMTKHLNPLIPPHRIYIEPFAGSLAMLLAKCPSKREVASDLHCDLMNFYKVLQDPVKANQLAYRLKWTLHHQEEHRQSQSRPDNLGDVERAARFFIDNRMSFNAIPGQCFSKSRQHNVAKTFHSAAGRLDLMRQRLTNVTFLTEDFEDILNWYDSEDAFIFADPPYLHSTRKASTVYAHEMPDEGHVRLLNAFKRAKGMVMLCGYASDLYDQHLTGWEKRAFTVKTSACAHTNKHDTRDEVVWMNYTPPADAKVSEAEAA